MMLRVQQKDRAPSGRHPSCMCCGFAAWALVPSPNVSDTVVCHQLTCCMPYCASFSAACLHGRVSQDTALLLACACKASSHQPLLLSAHANLAAALEATKQHSAAVTALQYCLALLHAGEQQGDGAVSQAPTHTVQILQTVGHVDAQHGLDASETVAAALQLAVARNLCLAGQYERAVQLYAELEGQGLLQPTSAWANTYSLLCYGYAAQQTGQAELCSKLLQQALQGAVLDLDKLHAVTALLQVNPKSVHSRFCQAGTFATQAHLPSLDMLIIVACLCKERCHVV